MPNFSYPLAVTGGLQVQRVNRVLSDAFEDGGTSARRLWGHKMFKRRFRVRHAPLTALEIDAAQGFYSQRNGPYDSFWFRDNVNREGNAEVRFAGPLIITQEGGQRLLEVELEEVAPIVQNPSLHELKLATQSEPVWWWDANRSCTYIHANPLSVHLETFVHDTVGLYKPVWTPGAVQPTGAVLQWQYWKPLLNYYARTTNSVPLGAGLPGFTIFGFFRHSTGGTKQVIAATGSMGAGNAMGMVLSQVNVYEPWLGGGEVWSSAVLANSPVNTWRSIAILYTNSTNDVTMVVNGTVVGSTNLNGRNFVPGLASFGAAMNGDHAVNSLGTMVNADANHVMAFNAALNPIYIREIHNLFAYQFGLPTV